MIPTFPHVTPILTLPQPYYPLKLCANPFATCKLDEGLVLQCISVYGFERHWEGAHQQAAESTDMPGWIHYQDHNAAARRCALPSFPIRLAFDAACCFHRVTKLPSLMLLQRTFAGLFRSRPSGNANQLGLKQTGQRHLLSECIFPALEPIQYQTFCSQWI